MTRIRQQIENNNGLAHFSEKTGLVNFIMMSESTMQHKASRLKDKNIISIYEDVFESFVAALYIEFGYEICRKFMFSLIDKYVNF